MRADDLPEPAWWKRARLLKADGATNKDIAIAVGKSDSSVHYALNRDLLKDRMRRYRQAKPDTRSRRERDYKRMHARTEARRRWREEGYAKSLDSYYRQLECL